MRSPRDVQTRDLEFASSDERAGFRLQRLEIYNWGTFHERVWAIEPGGNNTLLTGDIGSGKSTIVDAISSLLVPPQKLSFNKAAGADKFERSLRTYVLGYYKSERAKTEDTDEERSAKPVALRDQSFYSVILGRFFNEGFGEHVTLAQLFWWRDVNGQPERRFVVAHAPLSIQEHFAGFGGDVNQLLKRLRKVALVEESFPPYATAFRQHFGIEHPQALDLFNQTVSMKSVGNLTEFVRQHMLEPFAAQERITALVGHFDDLSRAHEAVLKAKAQIERLTPIVGDCGRFAQLSTETDRLRGCRDALRPWFAGLKRELLDKRLANLAEEIERIDGQLASLAENRRKLQIDRDDLKRAIADNGGDRIERIKHEIEQKEADCKQRQARADRYNALAQAVGLPAAASAELFVGNRRGIVGALDDATTNEARIGNELTDLSVEFRGLKDQHDELVREINSLRQRRSNIPARMLELRQGLCQALKLDEDELPFAGELIQVRPEERAWEGAAERVLHSFALSILVGDAQYGRAAAWVDQTHLGGRLVYYRVREPRAVERIAASERSLVRKLAIKPDSEFFSWIEAELARRFEYACCDSLDQFRRERQAITRAGQIKGGNERHEKDDRHRIDDRTRYVLGWSNEAKIAALEAEARGLEKVMQSKAERLGKLQEEQKTLRERLGRLQQLAVFESFSELDWKPLASDIQKLIDERTQLESESDVLRTLQSRLTGVERDIADAETQQQKLDKAHGSATGKQEQAQAQRVECDALVADASAKTRSCFAALESMRGEALGAHVLTVESCDGREKLMRDWLQAKIDAEAKKLERLRECIVEAMKGYAIAYPLETQEVDVGVGAAAEYAAMLERLRSDDLPRFERRFKELLNENTIREVANFQSQLNRERQTIHDRIAVINRSLREIDYNDGRYIELEAVNEPDKEIKAFREELRACTEGALTGSEDDAYSEAKFLQVKGIIERFRGREGFTELDRKWTKKVTDVREWFSFAASERWREDDTEHEHYADSGGKSGGQKEKLAYTVLAASLAYQFGLEWGAVRSRSFRFVVIDEAFGRGSDESTQYGLKLFKKLNLQLLIVTPLQKIHVIEPYIAGVAFVHNEDGRLSMVRNLTIEEYRSERAARGG